MEININILKAVRVAASSEKGRYYLRGVYVHKCLDGVIMVATDGHRMIAARQEVACDEFEGFIIPSELIDKVKVNRRGNLADLSITDQTITIALDGRSVSEKAIDGTFPAYARLIPRMVDGVVGDYNADYIQSFKKAAKLAGGSSEPTILPNGLGPALINMGDDLQMIGVIMPVRARHSLPDMSWLN